MKASDLQRYSHDPALFIDHLVQKNELGLPFRLLDHQREILRLAFAFDREGRLPWDTILFSAVKKSGKTTINAALALWWAFTQEPPNEISITANDLEQAVSKVFKTLAGLIRHNSQLAQSAEVQMTRVFISNGTEVKTIASDYRGEAGGNHGFTSWDELWGSISESSRRLWEELTPVPTRHNSIRLITTYAGWEGESHLLGDLYRQGVGKEEHPDGQGERIHPDLPIYANREARLFTYWDHEPRMSWQTDAYYTAQRRSLRPVAYLRLHENRWTVAESTLVTPELWDGCAEPTWSPAADDPDLPVWLGFDIGTVDDTTAVAVVTLDPEDDLIVLVDHRIWRPSKTAPIDLEATLEAYIRNVARRFRLIVAYGDPSQAHRSVTTLQRAHLPIKPFHQTEGNTIKMGETLYSLLRGRRLVTYPDPELRAQAMNTVGIEKTRGVRIAKASAARKVDAIVALSMACVAAVAEPVPVPLFFV